MTYIDQRNDKSGSFLVKTASRLEDRALAEKALTIFFDPDRDASLAGMNKTAEDVLLSSVYLAGQAGSLPEQEFSNRQEKLATLQTLHNMKLNTTLKPKMVKKASARMELLPTCNIATKAELIQAGSDFSSGLSKLSSQQRFTFAENFKKYAEEMDVTLPDAVKLYTAEDVVPREDVADMIRLRKVAMIRSGQDASRYALLEDVLRKKPVEDDIAGWSKLAETLDVLDRSCGLDSPEWTKKIPDATQSVFRVKTAEEISAGNTDADKTNKVESMTKSDIVGHFGEDALEQVEDENGEINRARLEELIHMFGTEE